MVTANFGHDNVVARNCVRGQSSPLTSLSHCCCGALMMNSCCAKKGKLEESRSRMKSWCSYPT